MQQIILLTIQASVVSAFYLTSHVQTVRDPRFLQPAAFLPLIWLLVGLECHEPSPLEIAFLVTAMKDHGLRIFGLNVI